MSKRQRMDRDEEQEASLNGEDGRDTTAKLVDVVHHLSEKLKEEERQRKNAERKNEELQDKVQELQEKLRDQEEEHDISYERMSENYHTARKDLELVSNALDLKRAALEKEVQIRQQLEAHNQAMTKMIGEMDALLQETQKENRENKEMIPMLQGEIASLHEELKLAKDNADDAALRHACACTLSNGDLVSCRFSVSD